MKNVSVYSIYLPGLLVGIFVAAGLYLSSLYNYLLFHTIVELASIAVAYGLFMIAWNSKEFNENRYIVFLGIAYLFIGSLDFVHTLAYQGLNIFRGYDANLPTQLWIAARYLESLSLLCALRFLNRSLPVRRILGAYSLVLILFLYSIFAGIFPDCYREGLGLTSFKIVSEYIISAILLTALMVLIRKRAAFDPYLLKLMLASLVFTICSEFAFTFYISVYGFSNLVGHYFKLLSFYLIYKAVIETGLCDPYSVIFTNMQVSQDKLRESEARFRRLAENSPEIIYRYDFWPEPHFSYVSPAATRITGYTPEEHYADPQLGLNMIFPEDRERLQRYISTMREHHCTSPEIIELRWIHKNDSLIWTDQHVVPITDAAGNVIALEGIAHDVTDRKKAEEALQQRKALYRQMFHEHSAVKLVIDPDTGNIIEANPAAAQFYGYSVETLEQMTIMQLNTLTPEEIIRSMAVARSRKHHYFEFQHRLASGDIREVEVYSTPITLLDGRDVLYSIIHDTTARKYAEAALRENEERYRKAQHLGRVGNWEYNLQTTEFWGSEEAKRIYGFDLVSPSFSTDEVENCIPERERVHQALVDLIERDQEYNLEFDIITHDAQERKTIVSLAELERDAQDRPLKVTGVIQDITERKRIEEALRTSEENFKTLFALSPDAILLADAETGIIVNANQAAAKLFEQPKTDLIGLHHARLYPPKLDEYAEKRFQSRPIAQNDDAPPIEIEILSGGRKKWVEIRGKAIMLDDKEYVLGNFRDTTERKQAEENLAREKALLKVIIDNIPIMITRYDPNTKMLYLNKEFERTIGWKTEELQDIDLMEKVYPDPIYRQKAREYMFKATAEWQEFAVYAKSGAIIASEWSNLRLDDGTQIGIGIDVTERKRAEEQIKASLKEKEVLLREIHHRVKNNLMVVQSLVEMQAHQTPQPEALDLFQDLHNRVMAMSMVHEDLYRSENLAQIEFGPYLERLLINIRQGFATARAALTVLADGIFLNIEQAIPCGLIVAELTTNAFKYAFPPSPPTSLPEGEESVFSPLADESRSEEKTRLDHSGRGVKGKGYVIRVEMRQTDQTYTLIVSDNGTGLPPAFDWRNAATLGLSLVRSWAVHQLKGRLEVDNQPGVTFRIVFPAEQ